MAATSFAPTANHFTHVHWGFDGATPSAFILDEVEWHTGPEPEPEVPDHLCVSPPLCRCDMNLCTCNTPDPGYSFAEYKNETLEALVRKYMDLGAAAVSMAYAVWGGMEQAFRTIANATAKVFRKVLEVTKTIKKLAKPRPHWGPPPREPVLTSVWSPPAYRRGPRGPLPSATPG